jgi:hypothetical protein
MILMFFSPLNYLSAISVVQTALKGRMVKAQWIAKDVEESGTAVICLHHFCGGSECENTTCLIGGSNPKSKYSNGRSLSVVDSVVTVVNISIIIITFI